MSRAVGIVRKTDELGRLCIPKEFRDQLGLPDRAPVEILATTDGLLVRPYKPGLACALCGTPGDHRAEINGQRVCAKCVAVLTHRERKA